VRFINIIFIFHMMLVVFYAVIRDKGNGVPCMGCFSFSCAFGSYCCVRSLYKKPIKPKNLKTFFKKLRFFSSPAVAYIANNSRTQRFSVSKFGRKVPHLRCDSHTSLKFKRSKVRVTRPISADTHRAPYLPNGKAYELQTWYTDGGRRSASATGAMTSKIKGQGRKVT